MMLAGCTIFGEPTEDAFAVSREAKAWFAQERPFPNLADVPGRPDGSDAAELEAELRGELFAERGLSGPEPLLRLVYPPGMSELSDHRRAALTALAPAALRLRVVGLGDDGHMGGRAATVARELERRGYAVRIEEVTAPGPNAVEVYAD